MTCLLVFRMGQDWKKVYDTGAAAAKSIFMLCGRSFWNSFLNPRPGSFMLSSFLLPSNISADLQNSAAWPASSSKQWQPKGRWFSNASAFATQLRCSNRLQASKLLGHAFQAWKRFMALAKLFLWEGHLSSHLNHRLQLMFLCPEVPPAPRIAFCSCCTGLTYKYWPEILCQGFLFGGWA